jgi:hypothetical protein
MNIFEKSEQKKKRKKKLLFYGFYGPLLYSFALLIATGKFKADLCFFNLFCVPSNAGVMLKAAVIYLYLLLMAVIIIYTYVGAEKLVRKKNHIPVFQAILVAIPLTFIAVVWFSEPVLMAKHYFFIILFALMSIAGLVMIEFRKKK